MATVTQIEDLWDSMHTRSRLIQLHVEPPIVFTWNIGSDENPVFRFDDAWDIGANITDVLLDHDRFTQTELDRLHAVVMELKKLLD